MPNQFLVSHLFFLTAFLGLLAALIITVLRQGRQWKPVLLTLLPVILIFATAYLGKHIPAAHRVLNIFYDVLLIYNAYYFRSTGMRLTFWIYLFAIISTILDFAMHFMISPS